MYFDQDDLIKGIYLEVLETLVRDGADVTQAINEAMEEVRSYLCARYDMDVEFSKTGDDRSVRVVSLVREIAIYNVFKMSNPAGMSEVRQNVYKDTIASLVKIQGEKATIPGLTRLGGSDGGSNFVSFGGNTRRKNQY